MKLPLYRSVLIGVALAGILSGCAYSAALLATIASLSLAEALAEHRSARREALSHG